MKNSLVLAISLASLITEYADGGELEMMRLKNEAQPSVQRMIAGYSRLYAEGRLVKHEKNRQTLVTSDVSLTLCDDLEKVHLVETNFLGDSPKNRQLRREIVYCLGKNSQFALDRDLQTGGSLALSDLQPLSPQGRRQSLIEAKIANSIKNFARIHMSAHVSLANVISGNGFKVVGSESLVVDCEPICRYRVVRDPAGTDQTTILFDLLPNHGWAIHRAEYEQNVGAGAPNRKRPIKFKDVITVEYGKDQDGLPIPSRVHSQNNFSDDTLEFHRFTLGVSTPEREFTLDHYGIPDATRPIATSSTNHFPHWMFGLGGLSLIAAALAWIRRTPRTSKPA